MRNSVILRCLLQFLSDLVAYPLVTRITDVNNSTHGADYPPGSTLVLNCSVSNPFGPEMYLWSSSCTGNCFIQGQTESVVEKNILHSIDSGNHTCTVTDDVGNAGSATYEVRVTGTIEGLVDNHLLHTVQTAAGQHLHGLSKFVRTVSRT